MLKEIRKVAGPSGAPVLQKIVRLSVPKKVKQTQVIGGSPAESARELVKRLRDEARAIE